MNSGKGIQKKLLVIGLIPLGMLSALIVSFGMLLLYDVYDQSIRNELKSTTSILLDSLDFTVQGDYSCREGMLFKGGLNITDSTILRRLKERSGIDTTLFWEDTRIMTTLKDANGQSAMGTKANPEVVEVVLQNGKSYYSDQLNLNGVEYVGYYIPLINSDGMVVGMIFAGKNKQQAQDQMYSILKWFLILSLLVMCFAVLLARLFSQKMIQDINGINEYLATIAKGDMNAVMDSRISARKDEIGSIGLYASKMGNELKKLIETDPLTSLYNRRSCNNKLKVLEKEKTPYSVVMCDIDWFKRINDNYGHSTGDYVLVKTSEMIRENVDGCGFASRWGGEEFLLVYQLDLAKTKEKVEHLRNAVRTFEFSYEDAVFEIQMTFGIEAEHTEESYEERITRADHKLYIGKNNDRDQIVI